jgi:predicted ester cyclase
MATSSSDEVVRRNKEVALAYWGRDLARRWDVDSEEFAEHFYRYHTEDYWNHATDPTEEPDRGLANAKAVSRAFQELFAEPTFTITRVTGEEDRVVVEGTFSATVVGGALFGIPARGQEVSQPHVHILRFRDGKICEHWVVRDDFVMFAQMGGTDRRGSVTHHYHDSMRVGAPAAPAGGESRDREPPR